MPYSLVSFVSMNRGMETGQRDRGKKRKSENLNRKGKGCSKD